VKGVGCLFLWRKRLRTRRDRHAKDRLSLDSALFLIMTRRVLDCPTHAITLLPGKYLLWSHDRCLCWCSFPFQMPHFLINKTPTCVLSLFASPQTQTSPLTLQHQYHSSHPSNTSHQVSSMARCNNSNGYRVDTGGFGNLTSNQ
jgi:hypothetical protein